MLPGSFLIPLGLPIGTGIGLVSMLKDKDSAMKKISGIDEQESERFNCQEAIFEAVRKASITIGDRAIFILAPDIEVMILDQSTHEYHVAWITDGKRESAWVHKCEIGKK